MKISVGYQPSVPASASPYRLRNENGRELAWANAFLDGLLGPTQDRLGAGRSGR